MDDRRSPRLNDHVIPGRNGLAVFLLRRIPGWADIGLRSLKHHKNGGAGAKISDLVVRLREMASQHPAVAVRSNDERGDVRKKAAFSGGDQRPKRMTVDRRRQNVGGLRGTPGDCTFRPSIRATELRHPAMDRHTHIVTGRFDRRRGPEVAKQVRRPRQPSSLSKSTTTGSRPISVRNRRNSACASAVVAVLVRGWKLTMSASHRALSRMKVTR